MVASVVRDGERDEVAVEEPLEIRVDGEPLAVTMRTPGNDEELALGFLHRRGADPAAARAAGLTEDLAANVDRGRRAAAARSRASGASTRRSSCGVCGKGALEEVAVHAPPVEAGPTVARVAARGPARPAAPARLRAHRRPARDRPVRRRRRAAASCARTSAATTRWTRSSAAPLLDGLPAAARPHPLRQRPAVVRARPEGGRRRRPDPGRRRRAVVAGRRAGGRPQHHAGRLRPRRERERLHGRGAGGRLVPYEAAAGRRSEKRPPAGEQLLGPLEVFAAS